MNNNFIHKFIINILGKEVKNTINIIGVILSIIIISSILENISNSLDNKSNVSQITFYIIYLILVTIVVKNFAQIINIVKSSINNLIGFSNSLIPLLITLMITTGNITSAGMLEPIILFMITFIGNFINNFLIPISLISLSLNIISNISDKVKIDKLSKYINSSIVWILGIILTLFIGITSLEGSITNGVDALTVKTTKAAVSNFIPIVGKILGDAVDTVMSCSNILKNAVGMVGVVVIISICIIPIIKLVIIMVSYYLLEAICQTIADEKIVKLLGKIGDTFKFLLAIMSSISIMLIIGVTLVIKISNSGIMMY